MPKEPRGLLDESIFVLGDRFLRRIPFVYLKKSGEISSAAFHNASGTNKMSVDWMRLATVAETIKNYANFGVASISAKLCWDLNQEIEWVPVDDNVAHCDIEGKKTESISKKFRDGAVYIIMPTNA